MRKIIFPLLLTAILTLCACRDQTSGTRVPTQQSAPGGATLNITDPVPVETSDEEEEAAALDPWGEQQFHVLQDEEREAQLRTDVVEITERFFVAQTNDVYLNPDDYYGKTIRYQGFYDIYTDEATGETYHYIARYGPGCCANDTLVGFEIVHDGDMPELGDWVEVSGYIELLEAENVIVLRTTGMQALDERGAETVSY